MSTLVELDPPGPDPARRALPVSAAPVPAGHVRVRRDPNWMLAQLPVQMRSEDFFVRFVSIFQELGTTLLEDADGIEHVVDLAVAPPRTVRWLGSWVGVDNLDEDMPESLQRRVVASTAATLGWRGTAVGLRAYLELLSDGPVEVAEGGGVWRAGETPEDTAWVRITVRGIGSLGQDAFVEMVRDEIPAHVRAEIHLGDERIWSSEEDESW